MVSASTTAANETDEYPAWFLMNGPNCSVPKANDHDVRGNESIVSDCLPSHFMCNHTKPGRSLVAPAQIDLSRHHVRMQTILPRTLLLE
jgi:hypothetical protein